MSRSLASGEARTKFLKLLGNLDFPLFSKAICGFWSHLLHNVPQGLAMVDKSKYAASWCGLTIVAFRFAMKRCYHGSFKLWPNNFPRPKRVHSSHFFQHESVKLLSLINPHLPATWRWSLCVTSYDDLQEIDQHVWSRYFQVFTSGLLNSNCPWPRVAHYMTFLSLCGNSLSATTIQLLAKLVLQATRTVSPLP